MQLLWHLFTGDGAPLVLSGEGSLSAEPNIPEAMAELRGNMAQRLCETPHLPVVFNSGEVGCEVPGNHGMQFGVDLDYWLIHDLLKLQLLYTCSSEGPCCYRCNLEWRAYDRLDLNYDNPVDQAIVMALGLLLIEYIDDGGNGNPPWGTPFMDDPDMSVVEIVAFDWTAVWREEVHVCCR